jgi:hypothetical protein
MMKTASILLTDPIYREETTPEEMQRGSPPLEDTVATDEVQ